MRRFVARLLGARTATSPRVAATGAAMAGLLASLAVLSNSPWVRAALVGAAVAVAVGLPLHHLMVLHVDHAQEARDLWGLLGVMVEGRSWPSPGNWALAADVLAFAEREIESRGFQTVVELGPGASSVILGRRFGAAIGLYGVEHDRRFVDKLRADLRRHELDGYTLIHAPLGDDGWYSGEALNQLPDRIDLLIVDGPPNWRGAGSREPALEHLGNRLHPGAMVLIDDAHRPAERAMTRSWLEDGRLSVAYDGGTFVALEVH